MSPVFSQLVFEKVRKVRRLEIVTTDGDPVTERYFDGYSISLYYVTCGVYRASYPGRAFESAGQRRRGDPFATRP
eukprot:g20063.t1